MNTEVFPKSHLYKYIKFIHLLLANGVEINIENKKGLAVITYENKSLHLRTLDDFYELFDDPNNAYFNLVMKYTAPSSSPNPIAKLGNAYSITTTVFHGIVGLYQKYEGNVQLNLIVEEDSEKQTVTVTTPDNTYSFANAFEFEKFIVEHSGFNTEILNYITSYAINSNVNNLFKNAYRVLIDEYTLLAEGNKANSDLLSSYMTSVFHIHDMDSIIDKLLLNQIEISSAFDDKSQTPFTLIDFKDIPITRYPELISLRISYLFMAFLHHINRPKNEENALPISMLNSVAQEYQRHNKTDFLIDKSTGKRFTDMELQCFFSRYDEIVYNMDIEKRSADMTAFITAFLDTFLSIREGVDYSWCSLDDRTYYLPYYKISLPLIEDFMDKLGNTKAYQDYQLPFLQPFFNLFEKVNHQTNAFYSAYLDVFSNQGTWAQKMVTFHDVIEKEIHFFSFTTCHDYSSNPTFKKNSIDVMEIEVECKLDNTTEIIDLGKLFIKGKHKSHPSRTFKSVSSLNPSEWHYPSSNRIALYKQPISLPQGFTISKDDWVFDMKQIYRVIDDTVRQTKYNTKKNLFAIVVSQTIRRDYSATSSSFEPTISDSHIYIVSKKELLEHIRKSIKTAHSVFIESLIDDTLPYEAQQKKREQIIKNLYEDYEQQLSNLGSTLIQHLYR